MENKQEMEISLSDFWTVFKKAWIFMLIAVIVATAAAVGFTKLQKPSYSQSAKFFVTYETDDLTITDSNRIAVASAVKGFIMEFILGETCTDQILDKYLPAINEGYKDTAYELFEDSEIKTTVDKKDYTVNYDLYFALNVNSSSAEFCRDLLLAYIDMFEDADNGIPNLQKYKIIPVSYPELGEKIGPSLVKNVLIADCAVSVLVYAVFFIIKITNTTVYSSEDLEKTFVDVPVLAVVPEIAEPEQAKNGSGAERHKTKSNGEENK